MHTYFRSLRKYGKPQNPTADHFSGAPMRLGLQLSKLTFPGGPARLGSDLTNAARRAEDAGMENVWLMDHFFQIPPIGPAEMDMLEGYCGLSFLAGHTKRVRLGTMVTGITLRHPWLLVKTAT